MACEVEPRAEIRFLNLQGYTTTEVRSVFHVCVVYHSQPCFGAAELKSCIGFPACTATQRIRQHSPPRTARQPPRAAAHWPRRRGRGETKRIAFLTLVVFKTKFAAKVKFMLKTTFTFITNVAFKTIVKPPQRKRRSNECVFAFPFAKLYLSSAS